MKPNMPLTLEALAVAQMERRQQLEEPPKPTEPYDFLLLFLVSVCLAAWTAVIVLIGLSVSR